MRIAILQSNGRKPLLKSGYLIQSVANFWRRGGHDVDEVRGVKASPSSDIAVVHVDQTDVPGRYLEYASRHHRSINANCRSIRKDLFSEGVLNRDSGYDGKVIIKTTANFGGHPEKRALCGWTRADFLFSYYSAEIREQACKMIPSKRGRDRMERSLWRGRKTIDPYSYPIVDCLQEVPDGAWENERLMVEEYRPEIDHEGRFVMRCWYFLGDRSGHEIHVSRDPIVKYRGSGEQLALYEKNMSDPALQETPVPKELTEVRKKLNLDYGRIDWAFFDGKPVIYDVNKTPVADYVPFEQPRTGRPFEAITENLSRGLFSLADS